MEPVMEPVMAPSLEPDTTPGLDSVVIPFEVVTPRSKWSGAFSTSRNLPDFGRLPSRRRGVSPSNSTPRSTSWMLRNGKPSWRAA